MGHTEREWLSETAAGSALVLAYGQGHGLELVSDKLHYHALLQRGRSAAEDGATLLGKEKKFVLQAFLKGIGQTSPINHKAWAGAGVSRCGG